MNTHWKIILFIISFFLLQSCATSGKPGVNRVETGKETQSSAMHSPNPGVDIGKEKTIPGVREIILPDSGKKKYTMVSSGMYSWKDYMRTRFPGKKVVFPEELPKQRQKAVYHVGPDDILSVLVWNHPDLSVPHVLVRRDGEISLPLVGNIGAAGLTIPELEKVLRKRLERFITNPQVTINPKEMNSLRIFLTGYIRKPYFSTGPILPVFLLKGGNTLLEILSDVEFYTDADLAASYVHRGNLIIPVNIKELLKDGDLTQNVVLEPGDTVVIPGPLKEVNVLGEVNAPGKLKVNLDTTLLDAISLARGVKRESADIYMAYVARDKQILPVNLKRLLDFGDMSQNMVMKDGDIVYIPNSDEMKYYVLGEVGKPGVVHYRDPVDIVEAIAQGGGFLTTARRGQVVLVRGDIRSPQIYEMDLLAMMQGKSFDRIMLQRGDIVYVPRTYIADWNVFVNQLLPTLYAADILDVMRRR